MDYYSHYEKFMQDIGILTDKYVYSVTDDNAIDIVNDIVYEFGCEFDENLTKRALKLKRRIIKHIKAWNKAICEHEQDEANLKKARMKRHENS